MSYMFAISFSHCLGTIFCEWGKVPDPSANAARKHPHQKVQFRLYHLPDMFTDSIDFSCLKT